MSRPSSPLLEPSNAAGTVRVATRPTLRVCFATNVVSPYRRPVFEDLAATAGWQLTVLVNAAREFDRSWDGACPGVDVRVSRSLAFRRRHVAYAPERTEHVVTRHVPVGLWADLRQLRPDVVISHELGPRSAVAAAYCRRHDVPLVVWSYQGRSAASGRGRLRAWVRRFILDRAAAVVGMGVQAREVLESFGVSGERIVDAPNATDPALMVDRLAASAASGRLATLRAEIGGGRRIAVVPGRMLPLKGIDLLLDLWRDVPDAVRDRWTLLFVGDGPMARHVDTCALPGVQRRPAVPMHEVADYYGIADLHVFASLADVWGLVVNEAMLCGVPTLCSVHAGCADDLIDDGVDGLLFDPRDRASASARLLDALTRSDLPGLGRVAAERGRAYTPHRLARSFRAAVQRAVAADQRRGALAGPDSAASRS